MIAGNPPRRKRSKTIKLEDTSQEASKRRKPFEVGDDGKIVFDEEKLKMILGFKKGEDYIEVLCGSTYKGFGDYVGRLKINNQGEFFVTCECYPDCPMVNVTPRVFAKHVYKQARWKTNIWVHSKDGDKVPLWRTPLMKYYTHQENVANWKGAARRKHNHHRDEFLRCTSCKKERRFRLNSRSAIKEYHDALTNKSWTCSLWPNQKRKIEKKTRGKTNRQETEDTENENRRITCDYDEERPSLRRSRGCERCSTCKGCPECYCEGCIKCRFEDCSCRECRDFMLNAEP